MSVVYIFIETLILYMLVRNFYSCNIFITDNLKSLKRLDTIAMTTNGLTLLKSLAELQEVGLNAVNVSLDTLQEKKFEDITRRKGWSKIMAGIDYALQMGFNPVKVIPPSLDDCFNGERKCGQFE